MSDFTAYDITELMIQYGGGFVSGLGRLYRAADASNQAKLLAAFPEYFAQYREMAARGERPECPQPCRFRDGRCTVCGEPESGMCNAGELDERPPPQDAPKNICNCGTDHATSARYGHAHLPWCDSKNSKPLGSPTP